MPFEFMNALGAALAVMAVSLSGVIFSFALLRTWMDRMLPYLATFAAGVFVMVIYHLVTETFREADSIAVAAGAILFGAVLMETLHHALPAHHHHGLTHDHAHTPIDGRRVLVSDAFHNVGDGILLVAAFSVSSIAGIIAAIGVMLHEFVQEVSEFFILKEAGYSTRRALQLNIVSSSTILIGIALAIFLSSSEHIVVLFAGIATGGFLALLVRDLVPHAWKSARSLGFTYHAVAFALGIVLMFGVQSLAPYDETANDTYRDDSAVLILLVRNV